MTKKIVGTVNIERAKENALFLMQEGGTAKLPDGRKASFGSTCGLGGASLVILIPGKNKNENSRYFTINAHDVFDILNNAGYIDDPNKE